MKTPDRPPSGQRSTFSPLASPGTDTRLSESTFRRIRDILHQRTGIALAPHKIPMVQSRLNKRLRTLNLRDYESYLDFLQSHPDQEEWTLFINALTTNLTRFFREPHHFTRLVEWISDWPPERQRKIRVWSAGCSTGEEPYTLAMVLLGSFPRSDIKILATDIDSNVLATASEGVYPSDRVKDLDRRWLNACFLRGKGSSEGKVRVRGELRQLIEFRILNLLQDPWPPKGSMDAVFCRNVMIYFDKPTQRGLVQGFRKVLGPAGFLAVGHSESLLDAHSGFDSAGETVYFRSEEPT